MSDPSLKAPRKKLACPGAHTERADSLKVRVQYRGRIHVADFSELAYGRRSGAKMRSDTFRGRPQLAIELAGAVRRMVQRGAVFNAASGKSKAALCALWRFLDNEASLGPVDSVSQVHELHAELWIRRQLPVQQYVIWKPLVDDAQRQLGLHPRVWPQYRVERDDNESPEQADINALYRSAKKRVQALFQKWDSVSLSQARLENLKDPEWPLLGALHSRGGVDDRDALLAYFPGREDVINCLWLVVIQTGWNASTAVDIDISDDRWAVENDLHPGTWILTSIKKRGGNEQFATSDQKSATSAYRLIKRLLTQCQPLRERIRRRIGTLEGSGKNADDPELLWLRTIVRSPWLYLQRKRAHLGVGALTVDGYRKGSQGNDPWPQFVAEVNDARRAAGLQPVSKRITLSSFRVAFAGFGFKRSRGEPLIVRLLLGHKGRATASSYVHRLQWKLDGHARIRRFQSSLWQQIETGIVDAPVLRAMVERGRVSKRQARRWQEHRDRTRIGLGCLDFNHPPKDIAPEHKPGMGCHIQRCGMCPNGITLPDSMDGLAKRVAELLWYRERTPVTMWESGSFPQELSQTLARLQPFDTREVEAAIEKWCECIATGNHYVPPMEGSYD